MNFILPFNCWLRSIRVRSAVYSCMFPDMKTANGLISCFVMDSGEYVWFCSIFSCPAIRIIMTWSVFWFIQSANVDRNFWLVWNPKLSMNPASMICILGCDGNTVAGRTNGYVALILMALVIRSWSGVWFLKYSWKSMPSGSLYGLSSGYFCGGLMRYETPCVEMYSLLLSLVIVGENMISGIMAFFSNGW